MELITATRANAILYWFLLDKTRPDDCFILPTNICPEVILTFLKAGIKLRFTDLDLDHLCLDMDEVNIILAEEKIRGILYNHTYGIDHTPINELIKIKKDYPNILLINDKCLCTPEYTCEESVFDLTLFSTNQRKQADLEFGGYGWMKEKIAIQPKLNFSEVDFVNTRHMLNDDDLSLEDLKIASKTDWLDADVLKINVTDYFCRITDFIARFASHKQKLIRIYKNNLPQEIILNDEFHNWRFQVRIKNKHKMLEEIFTQGLFASSHYRSFGTILEKRRFPVAETLEAEVLNFFTDNNFSDEQALSLCKIVNSNSI